MYLTSHILLATSLALVGGVLSALGGGGGLITLPTLLFVLGLPPHMAIGTNKLLGTLVTFTASTTYYKKGYIDWKNLATMIAPNIVGTIAGFLVLQLVGPEALTMLIEITICVVAVFILLPIKVKDTTKKRGLPFWCSLVVLFLLGFYGSFIGSGYGAIATPIVSLVLGIELLASNALSRCLCCISNLIAFLLFAYYHQVNYMAGFLMGVAIIVGGVIGSLIGVRFGSKAIRLVTVSVVLLTFIRVFV